MTFVVFLCLLLHLAAWLSHSSKSSSKGYQWNFKTPTADQVAAQIQQRAKSGTAGRLVTADLSEGAEQVRHAGLSQHSMAQHKIWHMPFFMHIAAHL